MTQGGSEYAKPLPLMEGFAKQFYEHCNQHELRFQRCKNCGSWRHVPRETCAACGSWSWEWAKSSGRGTVFSWTVVRRPMHPAFTQEVPYAPVIIQMEEGVRLVSWVVNCPPDELRTGMPVEVLFDSVSPDVTLPRFRRVNRSDA